MIFLNKKYNNTEDYLLLSSENLIENRFKTRFFGTQYTFEFE